MRNLLIVSVTALLLVSGCARNAQEKRLQNFITDHVAVIDPFTTETNLAYWDASTTGKPEDYDKLSKLQLEIRRVYSDQNDFALLKEIKESGAVANANLARQLD